jgi:hypothetical protein
MPTGLASGLVGDSGDSAAPKRANRPRFFGAGFDVVSSLSLISSNVGSGTPSSSSSSSSSADWDERANGARKRLESRLGLVWVEDLEADMTGERAEISWSKVSL